MFLTCTHAQARFPAQGLSLSNDQPLSLQWDCHHGDTFTLKVKGLSVQPLAEPGEPAISLEVDLTPARELLPKFEEFAALQELALKPWSALPPELRLPLTLAACHLPGAKQFIFSENAVLTASTTEGHLRLTVQGDFKSRQVPCQETDLLLHLERPQSASLLSYCFSVVRGK